MFVVAATADCVCGGPRKLDFLINRFTGNSSFLSVKITVCPHCEKKDFEKKESFSLVDEEIGAAEAIRLDAL